MVRLLLVIHNTDDGFEISFNPTMVRLLPKEKTRTQNHLYSFQSHNGAIAAVMPQEIEAFFRDSFNPTMVRLLLVSSTSLSLKNSPFNPTMVRLLRQEVMKNEVDKTCFQSHNGAIAAFVDALLTQNRSLSFNPTMVRLLHIATEYAELTQNFFQSHNGAIAAKAKFWGLRAKGKEMVEGLQSTFDCPKTLRGSTATDPSKLGHFRLKSPPRLYPAFKVLKTA
jgi:hypothetical protein